MELPNKFDHPPVCKLNNQICLLVSYDCNLSSLDLWNSRWI